MKRRYQEMLLTGDYRKFGLKGMQELYENLEMELRPYCELWVSYLEASEELEQAQTSTGIVYSLFYGKGDVHSIFYGKGDVHPKSGLGRAKILLTQAKEMSSQIEKMFKSSFQLWDVEAIRTKISRLEEITDEAESVRLS